MEDFLQYITSVQSIMASVIIHIIRDLYYHVVWPQGVLRVSWGPETPKILTCIRNSHRSSSRDYKYVIQQTTLCWQHKYMQVAVQVNVTTRKLTLLLKGSIRRKILMEIEILLQYSQLQLKLLQKNIHSLTWKKNFFKNPRYACQHLMQVREGFRKRQPWAPNIHSQACVHYAGIIFGIIGGKKNQE